MPWVFILLFNSTKIVLFYMITTIKNLIVENDINKLQITLIFELNYEKGADVSKINCSLFVDSDKVLSALLLVVV